MNAGQEQYILTIDQGTTSSRVVLFDRQARVRAIVSSEVKQFYPEPGWVEHDALEIWESVRRLLLQCLQKANIHWQQIAAVGITNQRETVLIWDKASGRPLAPAIVWQCRRSSEFCAELQCQGMEEELRRRSGLPIDPYFSASKLRWLLDKVPGVRRAAEEGRVLAGTIDSWLIWQLSGGRSHVTDVSNASRTQLYNIFGQNWDDELLRIFQIPRQILPEVTQSSGQLADFWVRRVDPTAQESLRIPICGVAGDQQAALFGQCCFSPGMVKSTYGTGGFLLANTGTKALLSQYQLLTTLAWDIGDGPVYALEGSVFNSGSTIQWLRDELGIIRTAHECDLLAATVEDTGGVYIVPAFTGLGAPWWDMAARATISGITRGTNKAHLCRAALEAMALQAADVCLCMAADMREPLRELRVDGGAAVSDLLLQFQADILNIRIQRPKMIETTALGAAFLAGLASAFWKDQAELTALWQLDRSFVSDRDATWRSGVQQAWQEAIERSKSRV